VFNLGLAVDLILMNLSVFWNRPPDMTIADWAPLVFSIAGLLALFLFFSLAEH
jgi:hypothetical protein